jgi:hypothetical protein
MPSQFFVLCRQSWYDGANKGYPARGVPGQHLTCPNASPRQIISIKLFVIALAILSEQSCTCPAYHGFRPRDVEPNDQATLDKTTTDAFSTSTERIAHAYAGFFQRPRLF